MQQQSFGSNFGERLKWVRQKHDLTLEGFGERVGVGRSYLSKLENGKNTTPSEFLIESVCRRFHVLRDWLLNGTGEPFSLAQLNDQAEQGVLFAPLPSVPRDPNSVDSMEAKIFAGMLLNVQPTLIELAGFIRSNLNSKSVAVGLHREIARILAVELHVQLEASNEPGERRVTKPISDEARFSKELASAANEREKRKKKKVQV